MKKVLFLLCMLWAVGMSADELVCYSYAPGDVAPADMSALGGARSQFVQGVVEFNPDAAPAWARLKGRQVKGIRCYVRADYKQARQKRSAILACVGTPSNIVNTTYADLVEGWNDVAFSEPITIGDDKLYLGIQAYETLGTPYPLVAYAPATVPQSCFVNQAKKSWEEYTDRGTLLIGALLDGDAAPLLAGCVYAQNTTHPQTVAPDADFEGGLYIHNFSTETINAVEVTMLGEGATQPTRRMITLPEPVGPYGGTVVTTLLHSGLSQGSSVDWTATVTQANGTPTQDCRPGTTKLFVTRDNFIRVPLVEEFTSQMCTNCPFMAYYLDQALELYQKPYVYLSHHSGFREDTFTSDVDRELTYVFGGYTNEYNPAIMYNRAVFEGEDAIVYSATDNKPDTYLAAVAYAAEQAAAAEVNVTHTDETVTVSGRVLHDLIGTSLFISCYLVEDGISEERYPQMGMDDEGAPADLKQVFRHNGVILHHFNSAAIGDPLTTDADGHYTVTYPMVQKTGFGGTARRLVALVHKVNKNNLRENEALNVTQEWLSGGPDGIGKVKKEASDRVIYDLSGRRVNVYPSTSNVQRPQRGIYIVGGRKVVVR